MTTSDWIAGLALLASVFAVGFNAYYQYFKRGGIAIIPGERVFVNYGIGHKYLELMCPLTFLNRGAQYGLITSIDVRLTATKLSIPLHWWGFYEASEKDVPDQPWQFGFDFKGIATDLIVPDRQAIAKWVLFDSEAGPHNLHLTEGEYTVNFAGRVHPGVRMARATAAFSLNADDAKTLAGYTTDKLNRTPKSLSVEMRPDYGDRPRWLEPINRLLNG